MHPLRQLGGTTFLNLWSVLTLTLEEMPFDPRSDP